MKPWRVLADVAHASGAFAAMRPMFAGRGAILMFHEIQDDPTTELMTGTSTARFERLILWARAAGWDIVSLDDALARSAEPGRARFVVLTFDDGYRDNVRNALPVLERHGLPFTVYVPTQAIMGGLYSWWLGLRHLLLGRETVDLPPMNRRFTCGSLAEKAVALRAVERWVHEDRTRASAFAGVFDAAGINLDDLNRQYFLDAAGVRALSRHPLATIGAHTVSHRPLTGLGADVVAEEMTANRAWLEGLIDKRVHHFAYPYGAGGAREAEIAAASGFASAVRASGGPVIDPAPAFLLPRVGVSEGTSDASFDAAISGVRNPRD